MSKTVKLTIDGRKAVVSSSATVLEAAAELGIEIPTLCHHAALSPQGACRVCIVELAEERNGKVRRWIDASCVCPVSEGLEVKTDSPRVLRERRMIVELLLSRAPESEALAELARSTGAEAGKFKSPDEGESNCILCGLCVRVCNELVGAGGIGTAFRGIHKQVVSPLGLAGSVCLGCMACAYVCPTGAIQSALTDRRISIPTWSAELEMSMCTECGKPVAPRVYLEKLKQDVNLREEIFSLCPECRRKQVRVSSGEYGNTE
jgi:bidirectional [NiFe] hydrogenase diaphorase subunit